MPKRYDGSTTRVIPVADVPILNENHYFVCAEDSRLAAMQEAQQGRSLEQRLETTALVGYLYDRQVEALAETMSHIADEVGGMSAQEKQDAVEWIREWTAAGQESLSAWADYEAELVTALGAKAAQAIADGRPTERAEAVAEEADRRRRRDLAASPVGNVLLEVVDHLGAATSARPTAITCPACGKEVSLPARRCRYCGVEFDDV